MPGTCPQVVDLGVDAAFSLVSHSPYYVGPWVLERIDLGRATTETGSTFSVGTFDVASGYLWVSCGGDVTGPLLCQVDPVTLGIVRHIRLPPPTSPTPDGYSVVVTGGPGNTVWIGYEQKVVRVGILDGAVLSSVSIPSGTVDSIATDPDQDDLYVSLRYPTVSGKAVDAEVLEFDASTGRALAATTADSPVTASVAGGALTAVPGGVWTSFRTGMAGQTILLRQSDLAMIGPSSAEMAVPPPNDVFDWFMGASVMYGDGTLVLINDDGVLACIDPLNSVVRVQEHVAEEAEAEPLAVDAASGRVWVSDSDGLQTITPPSSCWG